LGEPSSVVAERIKAARERQRKRFASHDGRVVCNADMTTTDARVRAA
jgi:predicted ATPase with chaperone activity